MCDAFMDRLEGSLSELKGIKDIADKIDITPDRKFDGFDGYKKLLEQVDVVLLCTLPGFRPLHLKGRDRRQQARVLREAGRGGRGRGEVGNGNRPARQAKEPEPLFGLLLPVRPRQARDREAHPRRDDRRRGRDAHHLPDQPHLAPRQQPGLVGDGVPGAELVLLHLAERGLHRRAALPQLRQGELGVRREDARSPRPASAAGSGAAATLRSSATSTTTSRSRWSTPTARSCSPSAARWTGATAT